MKKILSILLLVSMITMVFSACNRSPDVEEEKNKDQNSTEETTDASTTGDENDSNDNDNCGIFTVTEEEWAIALNLLLKDNYIDILDSSMENADMKSCVEKNGDNIRLTTQQMGSSLVQYWIVQEGQYQLHDKQDPNGTYTYWVSQFEYHNIFLFEDFEYDEKTNTYISDKVIYNVPTIGEVTFLDLSLQFENGKIVKLSYTQMIKIGDAEQMELICTEPITYGAASEIILPSLD